MQMSVPLKKTVFRFSGFSLIGAANTLLSMLLIYLMNELLALDYLFSYCTAYIVTVFLAYWANAKLVFHKKMTVMDCLKFFATYLSGMILGSALLCVTKRICPTWNATWISYGIIPVTMLWNFFFVNKILTKQEKTNGK